MKLLLAIAVLSLSAVPVFGAEMPPLPPLDSVYFEAGQNPSLTPQERDALAIAKKWQNGDTTALKPVQGPDGSIRFLFGAQQPSLVCAVMQVTDIELEPGEAINSIHLGDAARWLVEPAITGEGVEVQHIVVKPMDVGLETSLMVTTNRRTYHLRLKSHKTQYMPRVSFIYADAVMARWEAQKSRQKEEKTRRTMPESGEYLDNLDFSYRISGDGIKPVRVYNDGLKTIIQMPANMSEAPSLLVLSDGEEILANYRLQGDRYIVDSLFDKAMLIAGVGSSQRKTVITRGR